MKCPAGAEEAHKCSVDPWSLASTGGLSKGTVLQAVEQPQGPTQEFIDQLKDRLLQASWHPDGPAATARVLPASVLDHILRAVLALVKTEGALVELSPSVEQLRVTVVGDTHGQFQDVCNMLQKFGSPTADRMYIFNGDFVDRGNWGVEILVVLLLYKWLLPNRVYLLRGNHETSWCTKAYGFKNELMAKYGTAGKELYKDVVRLFAQLPLAALVEGNTLILHGGLFRVPPPSLKGVKGLDDLPEHIQLRTGSLDDLRSVKKGSPDPNPDKSLKQLIASDVLWSDPSCLQGHHPNMQRGVGTRFGPDVTEAFLSHNQLKLIIRSHEGPDARHKRPPNDRMPSIDEGFCVDHETPSGKLVTLFSAPDYPLFSAPGDSRFHNKAAVLHLTAPDYATPVVESFEAVLPRPQGGPFYVPDSMSSDSEPSEDSTEHDVSSGSTGAPPPGCSSGPSNKAAATPGQQQQQQQGQGQGHHHHQHSKQQQQLAAVPSPCAAACATEPATTQERRYPKRQRS